MRIRLVIFLMISALSSFLFANERSQDEMNNVALNVATIIESNTIFTIAKKNIETTTDAEYQMIKLNPKGWVMVSKDDTYTPYMGYNFDDYSNLSIKNLQKWTKNINSKIMKAKKDNIKNKTIITLWNIFSVSPEIFKENLLYKKLSTSIVTNLKKINVTNAFLNNVKNSLNQKNSTYSATKSFKAKSIVKKGHLLSPSQGEVLDKTSMTVKWQRNSATKIKLWVYQASPYKILYYGDVSGTSKTITGLRADGSKIGILLYTYIGTGYFGYEKHYVKAIKTDTEKLNAPSHTEITNITQTSARLNWKDNSNNELGYKIYKGSNYIKTLKANTTFFLIKNLTAGTKYMYSVKAYNTKGETYSVGRHFITKIKQTSNIQSTQIAQILSPNSNMLVATGDKITVKWQKNAAIKTYLMVGVAYNKVRGYGGVKVNISDGSATFTVPALYDDLLLELVSKRDGKVIGRDNVKLYPDNNRVQGTQLIHPHSIMDSPKTKVIPGTLWTVKWKNHGAKFTYLIIQYFNSKTGQMENLYRSYIKSNQYTFTVPEFNESISVALFSYDEKHNTIAKDYYSLGRNR